MAAVGKARELADFRVRGKIKDHELDLGDERVARAVEHYRMANTIEVHMDIHYREMMRLDKENQVGKELGPLRRKARRIGQVAMIAAVHPHSWSAEDRIGELDAIAQKAGALIEKHRQECSLS